MSGVLLSFLAEGETGTHMFRYGASSGNRTLRWFDISSGRCLDEAEIAEDSLGSMFLIRAGKLVSATLECVHDGKPRALVLKNISLQ